MRVRGPLLRVIQNFRLAVLTGLIRIGALEINEGATPGRGIPRVTDSGGILCGSRRDDTTLPQMIQAEISGQQVTLPELRCFHKLSPDPANRMGAVIAASNPFGKTWASCQHPCEIGSIFEMEIPVGESFENVRMRVLAPAERHELIAALKKSPRKLALAKGWWYEVLAD